ncbi:RNA polymerase sigma-70 factor [Fulvivirga sp. M361]|uniref:RNA polymerase sigma-70 factor n=1 Tax=Fulvivirga sp. M361 TaxID=2594266 RepID=UPI00117A8ED6|nr:RNA polymerase sigma-70 factor [Fulvivirga sp. M361]TRX60179.1 RNA polymerase sigma-70 factor [Fulvivirga sp. M361]
MNKFDPNITQELVRKLSSGDQRAFKTLYDYYGRKLYYLGRKYQLSEDESSEIVQDVFFKVWQKRKELNPAYSFNSYLITIAKNLIFNGIRKSAYKRAYLSDLDSSDFSHNDTEKSVIYLDLEKIASEAIEQLPPKRKNIFKLSRESGMSNQEIAESLNISKSTVENQMNKCLKFLKHYLRHTAEIIYKGNQ